MLDKAGADNLKTQHAMVRNWKRLKYLFLSKDNRGFTIVELLLYLSLLAMVLAGIYNFYGFAQNSWNRAEAHANVIQEARFFLMQVERDVRSARRRPNGEQAIIISEQGMKMEIYTHHNRDELYVSYIFQNDGSLERLSLVDPDDNTEVPLQQTLLSNVIPDVDNDGNDLPLFIIDGKSVLLKFGVDNPGNSLLRIFEIDAVFTVRNKEAL